MNKWLLFNARKIHQIVIKAFSMNINLLIRSTLLVFNVVAASWFAFATNFPLWAVLLFTLAAIQIFLLLNYSNSINKKIAFFFDAIENNDSTLHFKENVNNKSLKKLNKSLNRVNQQIQNIKLQSKEQEQFYQQMLEQVATGVIICTTNGRIVFANAKAKQLLKQDQFTNLVQLKQTNQQLYETLINLVPGQKRLIKTNLNQTVIQLTFQINEIKTRNEDIRLISFYDIHTELDEREVDAWIRLIRVLTHEIMNSIAPITSLSETIMEYFISNGQPKNPTELTQEIIDNTTQGLKIVTERGRNLTEFVSTYRKITKIPVPKRTRFALSDLIDKVRILSSTHPGFENTEFNVSLNPEKITVCADETQLTHVLINIVKNAIEASDQTANPHIEIKAFLQKDESVTIIVTDNGKGISAEMAEQVFVPFFTTKENGSGIGLSFSRQVIRMHNGTLNIRSKPGEGTSVIITI